MNLNLIKLFTIIFFVTVGGFISCGRSQDRNNEPTKKHVCNLRVSSFQKMINGKKVNLYKLHNKNDIGIAITNYGARIIAIFTPDRDGDFRNIVLGFDNLNDYLKN